MAMGQNPNRLAPSEHPNPTTKIGPKMGEFTYPKMVPLVLTHRYIYIYIYIRTDSSRASESLLVAFQLPIWAEPTMSGISKQGCLFIRGPPKMVGFLWLPIKTNQQVVPRKRNKEKDKKRNTHTHTHTSTLQKQSRAQQSEGLKPITTVQAGPFAAWKVGKTKTNQHGCPS